MTKDFSKTFSGLWFFIKNKQLNPNLFLSSPDLTLLTYHQEGVNKKRTLWYNYVFHFACTNYHQYQEGIQSCTHHNISVDLAKLAVVWALHSQVRDLGTIPMPAGPGSNEQEMWSALVGDGISCITLLSKEGPWTPKSVQARCCTTLNNMNQ